MKCFFFHSKPHINIFYIPSALGARLLWKLLEATRKCFLVTRGDFFAKWVFYLIKVSSMQIVQ